MVDRNARMWANSAFAAGDRQALFRKLLARLLRLVPGLAGKLQEAQMVFLKDETVDRGSPPVRGGRRQVGGRLRQVADEFLAG